MLKKSLTVAILFLLCPVYAHAEGNTFSKLQSYFDDEESQNFIWRILDAGLGKLTSKAIIFIGIAVLFVALAYIGIYALLQFFGKVSINKHVINKFVTGTIIAILIVGGGAIKLMNVTDKVIISPATDTIIQDSKKQETTPTPPPSPAPGPAPNPSPSPIKN